MDVFSSRSKKETGRGVNDDMCRCVLLLLFSSSLQSAIGFMRKKCLKRRGENVAIFRFFGVNSSGCRSDVPQPLAAARVLMTFILTIRVFLKNICVLCVCDEKRLNLST